LVDVNLSIDRDDVLTRHLTNIDALLTNLKPLSVIRGHEIEDEYGIADNIDLNKDYTPHCCALCRKTFLNYTDDKDYAEHENDWQIINTLSGQKLEVCSVCRESIEALSK
jgi:hypothetical protein